MLQKKTDYLAMTWPHVTLLRAGFVQLAHCPQALPVAVLAACD